MSNTFGTLFRITTFGESHGPYIGVVIDGCPPNFSLNEAELNEALAKRRPGTTPYTSPRQESDTAEIVSGLFEGKTTGMPLTILIKNRDALPNQYDNLKNLYRPGHANYTYLKKYGIFDYRGGGRASGRETAARVAASVVAKKIVAEHGITCIAYITQVGTIHAKVNPTLNLDQLEQLRQKSPIHCPDLETSQKMQELILQLQLEGDSIGAVVTCRATLPAGLGEPIFGKLEAHLASAMLSIPATKGFEIGEGFLAATMRGSEHNDPFYSDTDKNPHLASNHAGGTLAGISTGEPLVFRTAFKPASSIKKRQESVTLQGEKTFVELQEGARHDPCVAIRAVAVVEAMTLLVLADLVLLQNRYAAEPRVEPILS